MLIKNVSTLFGKELEFVSNTNVKIQDSRFKRIQPNIHSSSLVIFTIASTARSATGLIRAYACLSCIPGPEIPSETGF